MPPRTETLLAAGPRPVRFAIVTVSDTRGAEEDASGDTLAALVASAGHTVAARHLVVDEIGSIVAVLKAWVADPGIDVVLSTGGTGMTGRDVTPEAFAMVVDKDMPGFGELFRSFSYAKIGLRAMQSRALGGVAGSTYLFALPGSTSAVTDAWTNILAPQFDSRNPDCNLAELMPRLDER